MDLFATHANTKLPIYISPVPDLIVWKQDAFQHPWDDLTAYTFPLFDVLLQGLFKSSAFDEAVLDSCRSVLASERLVRQSSRSFGSQTS